MRDILHNYVILGNVLRACGTKIPKELLFGQGTFMHDDINTGNVYASVSKKFSQLFNSFLSLFFCTRDLSFFSFFLFSLFFSLT